VSIPPFDANDKEISTKLILRNQGNQNGIITGGFLYYVSAKDPDSFFIAENKSHKNHLIPFIIKPGESKLLTIKEVLLKKDFVDIFGLDRISSFYEDFIPYEGQDFLVRLGISAVAPSGLEYGKSVDLGAICVFNGRLIEMYSRSNVFELFSSKVISQDFASRTSYSPETKSPCNIDSVIKKWYGEDSNHKYSLTPTKTNNF